MSGGRILLLGERTQVTESFKRLAHTDTTELLIPSSDTVDFLKPSSIRLTLQKLNPDIVINTISLESLEECEANEALARKINFEGPAILAAVCSSLDIPLIHLSTDQVFDGSNQSEPYPEDAVMNPINIYGESRMMGEEAIRHDLLFHVILRTGPIYSSYGSNLVTDAFHDLIAGKTTYGITDQIFSPVAASDIAETIQLMVNNIYQGGAATFGTYHLSYNKPLSHCDFIQIVLDEFDKIEGKKLSLTPKHLTEITKSARVPTYTALKSKKFNSNDIKECPNYNKSIEDILRAISKKALNYEN